MSRRGRKLLSLSSSLYSLMKHGPLAKPPLSACNLHGTITFSTSSSSSAPPSVKEQSASSPSSNSQRESMILEQFRQRKLKGSSVSSSSNSTTEKVAEEGFQNEGEPTMVVGNFKELGVSEDLVEVLNGIGDFVPSEIQCVVIPAILEGKSLLLSSPTEPDRTLAYLLPLIQLLRRDGELLGSDSKQPRAIVLCATEEKAAQCFNAAKYIIDNAELTAAKNCASADTKESNASIGLIIGSPCEILQYIEEGSVVPCELQYLVLDGVDCMLGNGLGPEIHKILGALQDQKSKSTIKRLQTVMAISTITEVLEKQSPIVKDLERDHAGNISAMSLEMDETEAFQFTESLDALRKKVEEAMGTILS